MMVSRRASRVARMAGMCSRTSARALALFIESCAQTEKGQYAGGADDETQKEGEAEPVSRHGVSPGRT